MCLSSVPHAAQTVATPSPKKKNSRVRFATSESKVVGYTVSRFDLSQIEANSYWMSREEFKHIHSRNKKLMASSGFKKDDRRGIQMLDDAFSDVMTHLQVSNGDTATRALRPLLECASSFESWSHNFHQYRGLERGVARSYRRGMNSERFFTRTSVLRLHKNGESDEDISKMYRSVADASRTVALLMGLGDAWAAHTADDEDATPRVPLHSETVRGKHHGFSMDSRPTVPTPDLEMHLGSNKAAMPTKSTFMTAVVVD